MVWPRNSKKWGCNKILYIYGPHQVTQIINRSTINVNIYRLYTIVSHIKTKKSCTQNNLINCHNQFLWTKLAELPKLTSSKQS